MPLDNRRRAEQTDKCSKPNRTTNEAKVYAYKKPQNINILDVLAK